VTTPSPTLLPPGKRSNSELVYDARAGAGLLNERDRATVKAYQKVKRLFWGPTYFQQGPILRARPTPPVQHTLGVGYARCGSQYLIARRVLPPPRARRRTVKPFEQRELHRTVTIRPELEIPNQKVTLK
jgi:hypothetical protein